jgi:hypothetical protein
VTASESRERPSAARDPRLGASAPRRIR